MEKTIRDWVNFIRKEKNVTFAIQDIHGVKVKLWMYKPADEFIAFYDINGYSEWLDTVPIRVNTYNDTVLFEVSILGEF